MNNVNGAEREGGEGGDVSVGRGGEEAEGGEGPVGRGSVDGDFAEADGGEGVVEGGQGEEEIVSREGGRVWTRGENMRSVRGSSNKRVR